MTISELIKRLREMPQDAIAVDSDDLEIIAVDVSLDNAIVRFWPEPK